MLVAEAMGHSPELREIREQVAAQQRVLASARRSFWMPTFSLNGRFDRVVDEGGDGSGLRADDDDQWTVGVEAGIPLFEGGRRVFEQRQAYDTLLELRLRESAARKRVDGAVRTAAFQAWSSLMAIDLSRSASESAARNLELVTGSYSRGAVSVVELLDAQNAATTSADEAENAVFDYLVDLLSLQREIGRFWLFLSEDERAAELDRAHVQLAGQETR
jgi:outer membrane protein TolC